MSVVINTLLADDSLNQITARHIGAVPQGVSVSLTNDQAVGNVVPLYVNTEGITVHLTALYVQMQAASGAFQTDTYTVSVNGAPTILNIGITNSTTGYTAGVVNVPANGVVTLGVDFAAGSVAYDVFAAITLQRL